MRELSDFGVFNLRDVGGLRTGDGRVVREGLLLRSDSPHRIPPEEAHALEALGVALVVDLRSDTELSDLGTSRLPIATEHMPLFTDARTMDIGEVESLAELYVLMLEAGGPNFGAVVRRLAEPGALPALVHCTAGKDRTGLVVGLLLSALGVTDDEVAADYARTGDALDATMRWLADNDPRGHRHLAARPAWILGAEAATMHQVLGHLRERHGSIRGWCAEVGVDDAALTRLASALLTDP
jgi:protein-tyrosine phosphatase